MASGYEAAMALVQEPGAFAFMNALPPLPPFLLCVRGMDAPLAWPLCAAQATELLALHPSGSISKCDLAFRYEKGYHEMLDMIQDDIIEHLAPTGEIQIVLSHMAMDSVGDAATFQPRPTQDDIIDKTLTLGSLLVLLPSMRQGGEITFTYGTETASFDAASSLIETTFASVFLSTSIASAPITAGRRVALIFRLVYEKQHEDMRLAPPNQDAAIAAFMALAASPFDRIQRIRKPIAYQQTSDDPGFAGLKCIDKGLVDVLVATKCFDVALASRSKYSIEHVRLHFACCAPAEMADACRSRILDQVLLADTTTPHLLIFWPKHHRVAMVHRDEALSYLASALLDEARDVDYEPPTKRGFLGVLELDDVLKATMTTFSVHRAREHKTIAHWQHQEPGATPLSTLSRLLAQKRDLALTAHFVADILSLLDDVRAHDVALWLHGLLTTHGWGPFQPALLHLVTRWSNDNVEEVLHLLASFVGLDDAPLCPPLRQPHEAELLKRCYAALVLCPIISPLHFEGRDVVRRYLLLEAYVTTTAPQLSRANYVGYHLPPALISFVDAYVVAPPAPVAPRILACRRLGLYSDIAVGLASAMQRDPTIARSPLVAHVLDAFCARAISRNDIFQLEQEHAGLDVAGSLLYLALRANRLDDVMYRNLTKVWELGLLPVARTIITKHPAVVSTSLTSHVVASIAASPRMLARKESSCRLLCGKVYAPKTSASTPHELVRDAIELLRVLAPEKLPAFLDAWCQALEKTLEATEQLLLPLVNLLVVDDAPLCRKLLTAASIKPAVHFSSMGDDDDSDEMWGAPSPSLVRARQARDAKIATVAAAIAALKAQLGMTAETRIDVKHNNTMRKGKRRCR